MFGFSTHHPECVWYFCLATGLCLDCRKKFRFINFALASYPVNFMGDFELISIMARDFITKLKRVKHNWFFSRLTIWPFFRSGILARTSAGKHYTGNFNEHSAPAVDPLPPAWTRTGHLVGMEEVSRRRVEWKINKLTNLMAFHHLPSIRTQFGVRFICQEDLHY